MDEQRCSELLWAAKTGDPVAREVLIREHAGVILRIAANICGQFVSQHDDEWSVALCAFDRAITHCSHPETFMSFAYATIRNALFDYGRQVQRFKPEVPYPIFPSSEEFFYDPSGVPLFDTRFGDGEDPVVRQYLGHSWQVVHRWEELEALVRRYLDDPLANTLLLACIVGDRAYTARLLGVDRTTLKARLADARRRLARRRLTIKAQLGD